MIPLIFLFIAEVVATQVFKKSSPNGKLIVYLGQRDFVDRGDGIVDPIEGVVLVDSGYLEQRSLFGQIGVTFRYGRQEDEVMGLKFSKTMTLCKDKIFPTKNSKFSLTILQERLLRKLGNDSNVFPFLFSLPLNAPPSVTLQPSEGDLGAPLGTEYELKTFIGENELDPGHKRSSVSFRIRKVQHAALESAKKQPSCLITKNFTFSPGTLKIQVSLDRDIYYHGEDISARISITNTSNKSIRNIKVMVIQHCEVTLVNSQFTRTVAHLESREGCPILPGSSLTKVFRLNPSAASNKGRRGVALDGYFQDEDVNLASSTLTPGDCEGALGFVVSYSLRVKVNCGTLGGDVSADLPFKLAHSGYSEQNAETGSDRGIEPSEKRQRKKLARVKSREIANYKNLCSASRDEDDDEGNIIFQDFAKLRMSMSHTDV